MIFGGKFDRARKLQQEKMEGRERAYDDDGIGSKLEKGDTAALIISAMITILPVALIALGVLALGCVFTLLLNYLIACLAFRFTEVYGVVLVRGTLMEFFCGFLAPVELLFGAALRWSPLSYLAGYPALLLMDCAAVPPSQAALVLLVWSLVLGAVCAVVSRRSRVYFEGVGA